MMQTIIAAAASCARMVLGPHMDVRARLATQSPALKFIRSLMEYVPGEKIVWLVPEPG